MNVLGYDPEISVDAAWSLPAQVKKAGSMAEVLKNCDLVTIHVPLLDATRDLINTGNLGQMKPEAILLNFSRDGVINVKAVLAALEAKKLSCYVCDFPGPEVNHHPQVIALPHLGASTGEAEENCAVMVADQLHDYLEHGNVLNAVNFPSVILPRESNYRLAIANANVPNMLGQISTVMAKAGLNIHNMINKSKGEVAYTLVEVDSQVQQQVVDLIAAIPGVLAVRYLPLEP